MAGSFTRPFTLRLFPLGLFEGKSLSEPAKDVNWIKNRHWSRNKANSSRDDQKSNGELQKSATAMYGKRRSSHERCYFQEIILFNHLSCFILVFTFIYYLLIHCALILLNTVLHKWFWIWFLCDFRVFLFGLFVT